MAPKVLVSDKLSETAVQIFRDRGVEVGDDRGGLDRPLVAVLARELGEAGCEAGEALGVGIAGRSDTDGAGGLSTTVSGSRGISHSAQVRFAAALSFSRRASSVSCHSPHTSLSASHISPTVA